MSFFSKNGRPKMVWFIVSKRSKVSENVSLAIETDASKEPKVGTLEPLATLTEVCVGM